MIKNLVTADIQKIIDAAILEELKASMFYRNLANQCQRIGYFGAASYFSGEAGDELEHYQKHVNYLNDMGSIATIPAIPSMNLKVQSLEAALQASYNIEVALADKYEEWYKACCPMTQQHLLFFLEIQRKSIGEYGDLLSRVAACKGDECGLLIIDKEMGA